LSEFLKHLQARLQARKKGLGTTLDQNQSDPDQYPENRLHQVLGKLKNLKSAPFLLQSNLTQKSLKIPSLHSQTAIKPALIANGLTYGFMLAAAACLTYWTMRIIQLPEPPAISSASVSKGSALYNNQSTATAYGLFGTKPLVTDNILLKGVVITSKASDGRLDGFAIFEIDGKPTNAISISESLGKGLTLQSISDESATLLYEGQKLDFALSKNNTSKSNKKSNK